MSPFIIVVIKPELELVLNILKVIVRLDVPPVELSLHRFVKSFDLSIMFGSVRRIHDKLYVVGCKTFSECLGIESIVSPDSFNLSRKLTDKPSNEVNGIRDRIPLIYPSNDKSRTIIDCINGDNVSSLSEWKARIKLNLRSRLVVSIELRIILPSFVFSTIPNLVSFKDSPDGSGME